MKTKDKLIQIFKSNPGSLIELGTIWLLPENEYNKRLNLCLKFKIKKSELSNLISEIIDESIEVWSNIEECKKDIENGGLPCDETIYQHPELGYFMIAGGGLFAEDMEILTKEKYERKLII